MRLDIKPLSVNQAWKGKRFKTDDYKRYEYQCLMMLRPFSVPAGKLSLNLTFGFSSKASDTDNPVKCFQDILSKKYGFDDKRIYEINIKKVDVKKGSEFIEWNLKTITSVGE